MTDFKSIKIRLYALWIDHPIKFDILLCSVLFLVTALVVFSTPLQITILAANLTNFFTAVSTATGTLLGFTIAVLTFVVGIIPHVVGALNRAQLEKLVEAFNRAMIWNATTFAVALVSIMLGNSLICLMLTFMLVLLSTAQMIRTTYLLNILIGGVLDKFVGDQEDKESEETDSGETFDVTGIEFSPPDPTDDAPTVIDTKQSEHERQE